MAAVSSLASLYGAAAVLIVVSLLYFLSARTDASLGLRLLASSHGAAGALVFFVALAIGYSGNAQPSYGKPYLAAFILPVALMLWSFARYPGRAGIHMLQVFNVVALCWVWFIGTMAITGVWL